MTRVVPITMLYALAAVLVLAAPLAASEQPPTDEAVVEEIAPPAQPEAVAPETQPLPAAPEPSQVVDTAPVDDAELEIQQKPESHQKREKQQTREKQPRIAKAASGTVTISDFEFTPASITVDVGDTVTWSNAGPTPHSATADSFDTGIFSEGQSRSETFNEAGTFAYICTPHPNMKGTVTVQAASAQGGDGGGSSDDSGAAGDTGSTASDTGSATDSSADSASVATLPATGLDSGSLLALGLMTLALGLLLRRRTAATG